MLNELANNHLQRRRTLYGRRQARPLKDAQRELYDTLLPSITFTQDSPLNLSKDQSIWLEIGFGGGEHLCHQALNHPDKTFVGCEPFINGVGSLLSQISTHQLNNISIFQNDAGLLLPCFPDNSLEKVFLLFPDPWRKKRHFKRRFIQEKTLKEIHRLLKPQGEWRIATDHEGYCQWLQEHFESPLGQSLFKQMLPDIYTRPDPSDWPVTRYEQKALKEGRKPAYFIFQPI